MVRRAARRILAPVRGALRAYALAYGRSSPAPARCCTAPGIKPHFLETYLHVAVNVLFLALLSGVGASRPVAASTCWRCSALSAVAIVQGVRFKRFAFVVYGVLYGYAGVSAGCFATCDRSAPAWRISSCRRRRDRGVGRARAQVRTRRMRRYSDEEEERIRMQDTGARMDALRIARRGAGRGARRGSARRSAGAPIRSCAAGWRCSPPSSSPPGSACLLAVAGSDETRARSRGCDRWRPAVRASAPRARRPRYRCYRFGVEEALAVAAVVLLAGQRWRSGR